MMDTSISGIDPVTHHHQLLRTTYNRGPFEFPRPFLRGASLLLKRGGVTVTYWAHNPEATGSNPVPATKEVKS